MPTDSQGRRAFLRAGGLVLLGAAGCRRRVAVVAPPPPTRVDPVEFGGWPDCWKLGNTFVEAIVVPAVGRLMQVRLPGEAGGPLWNWRPALGRPVDPDAAALRTFGGDMARPGPQSTWLKRYGREWPPPAEFDQAVFTCEPAADHVVLASPEDPVTRLRLRREIRPVPGQPAVRVTSTFEKLGGDPVEVSLWSATQLADPEALFLPLSPASLYPEGYTRLGEETPAGLIPHDGLLQWSRARKKWLKLGTDTGPLLWMDARHVLQLDCVRQTTRAYPDHQAHLQIYTNPDPKAFVEFSAFSPLVTLGPGQSVSLTVTLTIAARREADPVAEAALWLKPTPSSPPPR